MKKRWLMTPIVVGLAALTVLGATAFAQGRGTPEEFASKVAETLQIDEAAVQDAFSQAHSAARQAALQSRLDALVEAGRITEEQAAAYIEWYLARPEGVPGFRGRGPQRGGPSAANVAGDIAAILGIDEADVTAAIESAKTELRDEAVRAKLDQLVADGRITQEQADEKWAQYQETGQLGAVGRPSRSSSFGQRGGRFGQRGGSRFAPPPAESNWTASTVSITV